MTASLFGSVGTFSKILPHSHIRVLDRFFGTRKFEARDSGFESKIQACFGTESMLGRWDAKNNPRDYGIARNFGSGLRD